MYKRNQKEIQKMFRHNDFVKNLDYPFNAGYVIYVNYFFPVLKSTGEESEVPLKDFPKAYVQNFEYFVNTCLSDVERDILFKTFKDKKSHDVVASELGISTKELTSRRTRIFTKLKSTGRSKYILSDDVYTPTDSNTSCVQVGDIYIDSVLKTPDLSNGGGEYRIINIRKGNTRLFSVRMSTNTNVMSEDDLHKFYVELAKISSLVKTE
jgi:hypothetical protein